MNKITAVIITKNEEEMIADCLNSVSFCDEVIVVDNGSEDKTVDIAKRMNVKVITTKTPNFAEIRNLGLKKATGEWVLYIDADERVTDELRANIKYQISNIKNKNISAYKILRKNFYLGTHEWPLVEPRERLFKKGKLKGWKGELHESPIFIGEVDNLNGYLWHYTHRNLTAMLNKTIEWSKIEAELRFVSNHPKMTWWRFPRVMLTAFFDSYIKQGGWKAGTVGVIESIYQAFSMFITYARLWELQKQK